MLAGLPAALFYCAAVIALKFSGLGVLDVIRDPAQTLESSSFIGFTSSIGSWFWVSAAAITLFTHRQGAPAYRRLLLLLGTFSALLAVDDFFLIHDRYVEQEICYGLYALLAASLWVFYRGLIIEVDLAAFLLAGTSLALSILTDVIQESVPGPYKYSQAFEEGFKFIGGAIWLYFCARVSASAIRPDN